MNDIISKGSEKGVKSTYDEIGEDTIGIDDYDHNNSIRNQGT